MSVLASSSSGVERKTHYADEGASKAGFSEGVIVGGDVTLGGLDNTFHFSFLKPGHRHRQPVIHTRSLIFTNLWTCGDRKDYTT